MTGPVGVLSCPVGELSCPVGKLTGPVGELTGPVGQLTGPVGELTGPVGELAHLFCEVVGIHLALRVIIQKGRRRRAHVLKVHVLEVADHPEVGIQHALSRIH